MTAAFELDGLDPFDLWDREAARLDAYLSSLPDTAWSAPSRCEGWSVRDVVAHLLTAEQYFRACLDGTVAAFVQGLLEKGATDLATMNQIALDELAGRDVHELVAEWRSASEVSRAGFRARGDGTVDTSVGEYPCRWQAFHIASELATHADDVGVPDADDHDERTAWRARFSRFALTEAKPELDVAVTDAGTRVRGAGVEVTVTDDQLVEGVMGRLDATSGLTDAERAALSTT